MKPANAQQRLTESLHDRQHREMLQKHEPSGRVVGAAHPTWLGGLSATDRQLLAELRERIEG